MYTWVKFLHVASAITFFVAHGASVFAAFRLKQEKELPRIQAVLDLSGSSIGLMSIAWLVLLVSGIVGGFMGPWWSELWISISLVLLLGVTVWMGIYSGRHYNPIRKAVGLPYRASKGEGSPEEPLPIEEIHALLAATNPTLLAVVGGGIPVIILWLMVFKPF